MTEGITSKEVASERLRVEDLEHDRSHTLILAGELDLDSLHVLEAALSKLSPDRTRAVTLDLSGLTFIDSTGLSAITSAATWCEAQRYSFSLIAGPESIQRAFEVTGLSDMLPFRKD
jgi:anti-anti-sigma factor